jgi:hypothetical protein
VIYAGYRYATDKDSVVCMEEDTILSDYLYKCRKALSVPFTARRTKECFPLPLVKRVILLLFWTKRDGTQTRRLKEIRNRFVTFNFKVKN